MRRGLGQTGFNPRQFQRQASCGMISSANRTVLHRYRIGFEHDHGLLAAGNIFTFAALLVFAAVTLAWWGFLAWLTASR
jgi:hypothetical protein